MWVSGENVKGNWLRTPRNFRKHGTRFYTWLIKDFLGVEFCGFFSPLFASWLSYLLYHLSESGCNFWHWNFIWKSSAWTRAFAPNFFFCYFLKTFNCTVDSIRMERNKKDRKLCFANKKYKKETETKSGEKVLCLKIHFVLYWN